VEPFFARILGQRYGWVPEPAQLKGRKDRQRQQRRSITDTEVQQASRCLNSPDSEKGDIQEDTEDSPEQNCRLL
jgi:hypothetical protein